MAKDLCACGRKIVVFNYKRKSVRVPKDNDHILCQRCWKSEQDRLKNTENESTILSV